MSNTIIYRVANILFLSVIIFFAYCFSLIAGEKLAVYVIGDLGKSSICMFVISIILASCIVFIFTLVIHYLYQIIPFLKEEQFVRIYHEVHLIFLYISGLFAVLTSMEQTLLREKMVSLPFNDTIKSASLLIFFIILSNYSLYNSVVINNDFKLINSRRKSNTYLSLEIIYHIFSIILSIMFIIRIFLNRFTVDRVSFLIFSIVTTPYFFKKLFYNTGK